MVLYQDLKKGDYDIIWRIPAVCAGTIPSQQLHPGWGRSQRPLRAGVAVRKRTFVFHRVVGVVERRMFC